jgi:hypothetical protein
MGTFGHLAPGGRRPWPWVAVAAAVLAAMSVWFFTARDAAGPTARLEADAPYYHVYAVSLLTDGDLDFTDEYLVTKNWYRFGFTPTRRPANVFGVGPAIFSAPFLLVGNLVARVAGVVPDGFSAPEVKATAYASLVFSLGGLFFAGRLCARRARSRPTAWAAAAAVFLAGPVVYYAVRQPGYAHPFATFFTAWFLDRWDQSFGEDSEEAGAPRSLGWWCGAGALMGAMALARPQLAGWGVLLAVAAFDDLRRLGPGEGATAASRVRRALGSFLPRAGAAALVAAVVFAPQMLAWKVLYGRFYVVPQGPHFMRWDAPAWSETLFSSRNGLFAFAPLYALAALGLLLAVRRQPRVAVSLIAGVALQALANGAAWDWWAGGSFGGRRYDSCYVAFAFGLAALFQLSPRLPARLSAPWARAAGRAFGAGARVTLLAMAATLAGANVSLAARTAAGTARVDGGTPAFLFLGDAFHPRLGAIVQWFSFWATAPARLLFRFRHGTGSWGYDHLVGVHFLGDRYPGLNSVPPARRQDVVLDRERPWAIGFAWSGGVARMTADRARLLLPLNRRSGPVMLRLALTAPAVRGRDAAVVLRWNGQEVARRPAADGLASVEARLDPLRRGVNTLAIDAPPDTIVRSFSLEVPPDVGP